MNLIIIGALPPPRGGVSTHVERLIPYLRAEDINYVVWDCSKQYKNEEHCINLRREPFKLFGVLKKTKDVRVAHCLVSIVSLSRLIFCSFLNFIGIRLTITFVGSPKEMIGDSRLKLFYVLLLVRLSRHVVVVNKDFQYILLREGVPRDKISVIPAFIPAMKNELIERPIPKNMADFCSKHKPLIMTYAYGPLMHLNEDLYGVDLIIELAKKLKGASPRIGFLVVVPEITNKVYFEEIKASIKKEGLDSLFCFVIGNQFSFVAFLEHADLFIRPTNTDGDALTVREALHCGIPCVSSDVCYRPEGTVLFRSRDIDDLYKVTREVLSKDRDNSSNVQQVNNAKFFIDVFKNAAV